MQDEQAVEAQSLDSAVASADSKPSKKAPRTNVERIKDYCKRNKVESFFFRFHDLWVRTKEGLIDCRKTYAAHKARFDLLDARIAAKTRPHVCPTLDDLLATVRNAPTRQQRRAAERAARKGAPCHPTVNNGTNHEQRHKMRHRQKNAQINQYTNILTNKDRSLKGPRILRKAVVRYRMGQLLRQMAPPIIEATTPA